MSASHILFDIWLILVGAQAVAARSSAESGDFLLSTLKTESSNNSARFGLTAISPTGLVRFSLSVASSGFQAKYGLKGTAISPDGKYAFTTANNQKEAIIVTLLKDSDPRVIQVAPFPKSSPCTFTNSIAVGPRSRKGMYAIYVGRTCNKGCSESRKESALIVLNLRYNPSNGKLTRFPKKTFVASRFRCGSAVKLVKYADPAFLSLQVLGGKPYVLLSDLKGRAQSIRLGSPYVFAAASSSEGSSCTGYQQLSPTRFVAMCTSPESEPGLPSMYRPIFVNGTEVMKGPQPPPKKYRAEAINSFITSLSEPRSADRFVWGGESTAAEADSRAAYAILFDQKDDRNNTIYRLNVPFKKSPEAVLKLDQSPLWAGQSSNNAVFIQQLSIVP